MKLQPLEKHITRLAQMPETRMLIISCYLNLENDAPDWRTVVPAREAEILDAQTTSLAKSLLSRAFNSIKGWLNSNLSPHSRGAALFVRGGGDICGHHYIYDESDLSKNTVQMTRSNHQKLHRLLQKLGYIVPHINIKEI